MGREHSEVVISEPKGSIQVLLESAELELESLDSSLLLTNLQSAFPAAVGLYYRGKDKNKAIVKFDGRKFHAPEGGWHGKQYYVNLGPSVACTSSPTNTYVGATKQFEKSVNVVQRMMESIKSSDYDNKPVLPICNGNEQYNPYLNGEQTPKNAKRPYENGMDRVKPSVEQELIDLANLNAAKDAIIVSKRNQLKTVNKEMERQKRKLASVNNKMVECEIRCKALNDELELFRSMGREQENMSGEITRLKERLCEKETFSQERILKLETALSEKQQQVHDLMKRIEQDTNTLCTTELKLQDMETQYEQLKQTEADVRAKNQLEIGQLQSELEKSEKCKEELLMANLRIHQLNEELHGDIQKCHEECEKIKKEGKENVSKSTKQLLDKNLMLEEQIESQRQQIIDYSSVLESMARENRLLLERLESFSSSKQEYM